MALMLIVMTNKLSEIRKKEKSTYSGIGCSLAASFSFEFLVVEAKVNPYYK